MNEFSIKLKNARQICGYTIKEATIKLRNAGVKISEKTLYNWESGTRTPDADEFISICDAYGIKSFDQFDGLIDEQTKKETSILMKFRLLDSRGKRVIESILDIEYEEMLKEKVPAVRCEDFP